MYPMASLRNVTPLLKGRADYGDSCFPLQRAFVMG